MTIRAITRASLLVAAFVGLPAGFARAELQYHNGDHCDPATSAVSYSRDNGAMMSSSSATQGFTCPLFHVDAKGFPYSAVPYYQPLTVGLGYHLPAGGSINCSPVSRDYNGYTLWGTAKVGTAGSGGLTWSGGELRASPSGALTMFCAITGNGGKIDGYYTLVN
jgi:hypothetical protein